MANGPEAATQAAVCGEHVGPLLSSVRDGRGLRPITQAGAGQAAAHDAAPTECEKGVMFLILECNSRSTKACDCAFSTNPLYEGHCEAVTENRCIF